MAPARLTYILPCMNSALTMVLPADVAEIGVVIAALGVGVIFLYRSGDFYRRPDPAFSRRFPLFQILLVVSLGSAWLSALLGLGSGALVSFSPWYADLSVLLFAVSIIAIAAAALTLLGVVATQFRR